MFRLKKWLNWHQTRSRQVGYRRLFIQAMTEIFSLEYRYTCIAIMNRTMTAGIKSSEKTFFGCVPSGRSRREIYICQAAECGGLLPLRLDSGLVLGFLAGERVFAGHSTLLDHNESEAQRALGFEGFFNKLPEETKDWWRENLMKPKIKQVNEKVQQCLKLLTVATRCDEQGKGYGSALIKEITRTAETPVCVNVNTDINILFYKRLGFEIVDASEMVSSCGSWVGTTMIWEASE
ncbi:hypothetical protein CPB84DRAFT_357993 [Gymnopilus junonius]|uniref:N-acetyltransferase domain-containing protein n=1 Tax=Gymnopilus junonius TaxID=109634 RepID=A0A9P5ND05_GYMJU|nr:hypothetical protein CPB84DRAFT_357993 [Gymnopilus junonius]